MMLNNSVIQKLPAGCKLQVWIPPNDRELIIRAKLKTGWSSRCSFNTNGSQSGSCAPVITDHELNEIEEVIKRANLVEKKERTRISRLIDRFKTINKPLGDGVTHCFICNSNFGLLSHNSSHSCSHCLKNVCSTCSFETACASKAGSVMLCKICVEYRDFLKKSGLWFNQNLTCEELPSVLESDLDKSAQSSPLKHVDNSAESSLDEKKNSIFTSESKYTNLESDTDSYKFQSAKSVVEVNEPEQESKLLLEEVALSKQTAANVSNLNGHLGQPSLAADNQKFLFKTSTLANGESTQNISLAFRQYMDTETKLGHLQFNVEYIESLLQLKIHLVSATNLPARDSNGLSDPYVKIHLLPGIAKATKLRSKTVYKNLNPQFNEDFHYDGVTLDDMDTKTMRLTVLDEDKFGFDFIGEYRLPLKVLMRNEMNYFNVPLEEKQELGDESDCSSRGKINFAVKYSKKTSCLFVKVNRCTQLLPMDNGVSSDPFVEVVLLPGSKENKHKFRTCTKRKTLDPEFNEEFMFSNIDLKSLLTKTIEISVWDKDFGTKNDFIGMVKLSQQRTGDELKHFFTIIKNPDLYHEKWHTLHMREDKFSNLTSE